MAEHLAEESLTNKIEGWREKAMFFYVITKLNCELVRFIAHFRQSEPWTTRGTDKKEAKSTAIVAAHNCAIGSPYVFETHLPLEGGSLIPSHHFSPCHCLAHGVS